MADSFIPIGQCEHGWLYHIKARNFRLGIFNEPEKEFIGIRTKFASHVRRVPLGHWGTLRHREADRQAGASAVRDVHL